MKTFDRVSEYHPLEYFWNNSWDCHHLLYSPKEVPEVPEFQYSQEIVATLRLGSHNAGCDCREADKPWNKRNLLWILLFGIIWFICSVLVYCISDTYYWYLKDIQMNRRSGKRRWNIQKLYFINCTNLHLRAIGCQCSSYLLISVFVRNLINSANVGSDLSRFHRPLQNLKM